MPIVSEPIRYYSTRDRTKSSPLAFDDLLLSSTAADGGLYLPESWPKLAPATLAQLATCPYPEAVAAILAPYMAGSSMEGELSALLASAYDRFHHAAIAPLRQLDGNLWFLELFHGPTFSFKDLAMQCLGQLITALLAKQKKSITILVATSGDTGSAAMAAFAGKPQVRCIVLYPEARVSEVQRRQMTTLADENVMAVAVQGDFDDCQALVKGAFARQDWCTSYNLTAVNSINWVRIIIQSAYYARSAAILGKESQAVSFVVPSGNFGNAYAGWVAKQMGAPIGTIGVATNSNDILTRFLKGGEMERRSVQPTITPSMDIQVASNFERLLFSLYDGDAERVGGLLTEFAKTGHLSVEAERLAIARRDFWGEAVSEQEVMRQIAGTIATGGGLVDPHSAVGLVASQRHLDESSKAPLVSLGCAHPAKFPDTIAQVIGAPPEPPSALAKIMEAPERTYGMANDLEELGALLEKDF